MSFWRVIKKIFSQPTQEVDNNVTHTEPIDTSIFVDARDNRTYKVVQIH